MTAVIRGLPRTTESLRLLPYLVAAPTPYSSSVTLALVATALADQRLIFSLLSLAAFIPFFSHVRQTCATINHNKHIIHSFSALEALVHRVKLLQNQPRTRIRNTILEGLMRAGPLNLDEVRGLCLLFFYVMCSPSWKPANLMIAIPIGRD